jgi:tetratricopeptide (TPR) repeat protein
MRWYLPAALLVLAGSGCTSMRLVETTEVYYGQGPDVAIEIIEQTPVRQKDQLLAAMELAVFHQELGQYAKSNQVIETAAQGLQKPGSGSEAMLSLLVNDEAGTYRGEYFEQVYVHTLRMTNHLALQEVEKAAAAAEVALATIAALPCDACRFPFTRYLAAVCFESAGRYQEAGEAILEAVVESPRLTFLQEELDRYYDNPALYEEVGFAPPPIIDNRGRRVLYVLLLLGPGPAKVEAALPLPPSHVIAWPRYVPRYAAVVTGAELRAGDAAYHSEVLTDVLQLASTSLRARSTGLIAKETSKTIVQEVIADAVGDNDNLGMVEMIARFLFSMGDRADLRHWSSLPASCQVLRVQLPDDIKRCELVYTSPAGEAIDRELLTLPMTWEEGPLFITRRMP